MVKYINPALKVNKCYTLKKKHTYKKDNTKLYFSVTKEAKNYIIISDLNRVLY